MTLRGGGWSPPCRRPPCRTERRREGFDAGLPLRAQLDVFLRAGIRVLARGDAGLAQPLQRLPVTQPPA